MVQIAGKYVHEKNENFEAYLKIFGPLITPEVISQYANAKPTLNVEFDGSNCKIESSSGEVQKFVIGQAYMDDLYAGHEVESIASINGNNIQIKSVGKKSGRGGSRTYEFTDTGLVVHYQGGDVEAKRYYKRN